MKRRTLLVCVSVTVALIAASLAVYWGSRATPTDDRPQRSASDGSVPVLDANFGGSGPGTLSRAVTMPGLPDVMAQRMRAARVTYRSTSGDGSPSRVTGSVFVPTGQPPAGGWPVIAVGHGTTGTDDSCAPSSSNSLLGYASVVGALVRRGFAVALPDYQGIGSPGVHPYTDARTAGFDMIDAVRALRATFRDVSTRWAAFGGSQGGGASWAADEQAASYAPELTMVGAVAVSPVADVSGLVDAAQRRALTPEQNILLAGIVKAVSQLRPDIDRRDFYSGADNWFSDVAIPCSPPDGSSSADIAGAFAPPEVEPRSPEAADRLRSQLARWALPQQRLSAPLYAWYGGADAYIDPSWTADAITKACRLGGPVTVVFEAGKGHGEINYSDQFDWLADRFSGKPVQNGCT